MRHSEISIVYKHTQCSTNKVYVGATYVGANETNYQAMMRRWNHGNGYRNCRKMWPAIVASGSSGFSHDILWSGPTKDVS